MESNEIDVESPSPVDPGTDQQCGMDHVLEILTSHNHALILVGCSALRWMGSAGPMTSSCDLLIRNDTLMSIASSLVETGQWELHSPDPQTLEKPFASVECDADLVL
ncbi:hypothetical protein ST47_g4805 [Ascochyta rabiei]|uniref:Uncharacterized protein n=1 Tax=Didymella rabiei TaxID=5454 RepID=A0A163F043_DIDRA|nr:hypothetical protein ST47_g4805 [Ascochyta rabiei]